MEQTTSGKSPSRSLAATLVATMVRFRWLIFAIVAAVTIAAGAGAISLRFDPDPRAYFAKNNPERVKLDAFEDEHGRTVSAVLMLAPADGDVLAPEFLAAVATATDSLQDIPGMETVHSVTNLPVFSDSNGSTAGRTVPIEAKAQLIEVYWRRDQDALRSLMSVEGGVSAVVGLIDPTKHSVVSAIDDIRQLKSALKADNPEVDYRLSGEAAMDAAFMQAIVEDIIWLAPFQGLLLIALLLFCLQSVRATIVLLIVLGAATTITMGAAGWLGLSLNGVTSATPMILLGLAVATCIHLLMAWQQNVRSTGDAVQALVLAVRINLFPIGLATLTTIISFLCLNFSDSPPFRQLGNLIALGLACTAILAFTLLPALVSVIPMGSASRRTGMEAGMASLGHNVVRRRTVLIVVLVALSAGAAWGTTKLRFDDRFSHYFSERFEFRRDTDFMEERLTGLSVLQFPIADASAVAGDGPPIQAQLDAFVDWLQAHPLVDRVNRPASNVGTESEAMALSVVLAKVSSSQIRDFAADADGWLAESVPGLSTGAVGTTLLAAYLSERNLRPMMIGTLVALVLVSGILFIALGNARRGVLSLIPNLAPLLFAYGFWGLAFGEMTFVATVVMALTFGIIVDDTVHVLAKYNRFRRVEGLSVENAIAESFRTVGIAVTATTLSIASGFLALCFSGFLVNHQLGVLTLMILFAAWVGVLFFLPPLLASFDRSAATEIEQA